MKQKDKTDIKQRFGLAIRKRRHELALSQEELSFRSELHRTYISDIERGSRNPSLENIAKLAKALEISVSHLFANYDIETEDSD
ncbi:MAG TPA: transcriptional regulator [Cyanobacteria bacterium UBA11149]|nr:transcriptional regulator [Cyanobacteria bacterium UBA11367]HBE60298.1 transcriptional regulator [Cyanobacteria bacterium UBA11366]HBK64003.1 transcriptional regulator [Cyanobacteria bacterium UBA11166]HBR73516.1 transcriptional regulator [Cyanobacteria bacterium UBA11159]HBS72078.1 transcriptional regulator [Cyanobacteria bacterium UBA11153]HBW88322.1 transcriptional regulator [Cyanobacteria bacterium UBA11149]HCA97309.1 transcriptional regulator [Cyanobacteria bacterium UBA9226]